MIELKNEKGSVFVSDTALSSITGAAATSCFGVKGMAGRSKDGGPLQLLRRESMSKGVSASFHDDGSVSLELHIAVDHGVNISALAHSIMGEVSYKVNQATGVPVSRVDVYVDTMLIG